MKFLWIISMANVLIFLVKSKFLSNFQFFFFKLVFKVILFCYRYKISRLIDATNALIVQFGAKNQRTSRVLYTNGWLDGWVDHAITEYYHEGSEVINLYCK